MTRSAGRLMLVTMKPTRGISSPGLPFDFGDHPARLGPACCMAAVLPGARIGEDIARHRAQPECIIEFANNPASDVTTEPRNCTMRRLSKSS
jgi:hypothetical protein